MTKNTPRIFISLLLMLLCIGILPVSAFASSGDYPDDTLPAVESSAADTQETKQIGTVTTNGGNLNVRTGAGLDNTAFTQLPNGTVVDVIGRDGDWVKILLPARVGYVYGSYLTVTDAADSTVSIGGITLPFDEKEPVSYTHLDVYKRQGYDGSPCYINPMDLNLDYSDDDNPLSLKSDFILSLCELIVGGKDGLAPVEKTIIDRCVRIVYRDYLNDPKPENMPLLEDLYNALRAQDEKEAQYIATALEIYVTGSLNVFNHHTNVDVNSRIVCYDIKELGKQLKKIGMLVVQDQVWNRVTINRAAHKTTRYYLDEFHLLLKEEQTASYSVEIWKRYRKWGGIPTGITQNVKDLLSSREVENIFENSDFIYMLNQAAGDRQILAKQLNISPHQLSYVTHSGEGEGLLFYGNTILPFIDHFPKDTELYRVMTTKPQEVASA